MKLTVFAAHLDRISIQLLKRLTIHGFATIFLLSITLGAVRTASANDAGSPNPSPASTPNAAPTLGSNGQPQLLSLVSAGNLAELRWPSFSDYHGEAKTFYGTSGYALAWSDNGRPAPQALAMIEAFKNANLKGLNPEDYDASRWDARIAKLAPKAPSPAATDLVHFDLALTICAMRYLSDLSIGRVNPTHVKFGPQIGGKKYDLADFLRSQILPVSDVGVVIAQVEPHYAGYQRAELALAAYEKLAAQGDGPPLPMLPKGIRPGGDYAGMPQLVARLHQLGDLPAASIIPAGQTAYTGDVVGAVKQFQRRHGLDSDGILGKGTIADLNTPLSQRVGELQFALERYRWIPPAFTQPPIVVNLPQFILRTMRRSGAPFLTMPVVVGKAYRKQTPVFTGNMRYVIFRPYWDVPPSIQQAELVPKLRSDRSYLASHNFEVVDGEEVVTDGAVSDAVFDELRAGRLSIRQKPGPKNSLGLVKFIFPNSYNVYLHSTPVPELFSRARRDFSHGCIRVQNPLALAVWVLRNDPNWNEEKIAAAMNGDQTVKVNLAKPIPVLIIYSTAVVEPDGEVRFFDDIYHYDTALQKQLASGYPYVQSGSIATLVNNPASTATHDAY
jgi:murein L,D-transpeptidase YcbB/YkuD